MIWKESQSFDYPQHIFPYFNPFDDESFEYAGQQEILQSGDADDHIAELPLKESEQSSPLPSPSQQLMSFIPPNKCSTPLPMSTATSTISMECHASSTPNESVIESNIVLQPEEPQPGSSRCINEAFIAFRKCKKYQPHSQQTGNEEKNNNATGTNNLMS